MAKSVNNPAGEATQTKMPNPDSIASPDHPTSDRQLPTRLRVALVDGDQSVHEFVRRAFQTHANGWDLKCYGSPDSLLATLPQKRGTCDPTTYESSMSEQVPLSPGLPLVVLTEPRFPASSGGDSFGRIRAALPSSRIVVLTACSDRHAVLRWVNAGAVGYLVKPLAPGYLAWAVSEVAQGRPVLSSQAQDALMDHVRRASGCRLSAMLSPREVEVLLFLSNGATYQDIATELGVSLGTAHRHVHDAYKKLGARGKPEALSKFLRGGGVNSFSRAGV